MAIPVRRVPSPRGRTRGPSALGARLHPCPAASQALGMTLTARANAACDEREQLVRAQGLRSSVRVQDTTGDETLYMLEPSTYMAS